MKVVKVNIADLIKDPIVWTDNAMTIIKCPNPNCRYQQGGNGWSHDRCPDCGQRTNHY